jgi:hypothetical protein
MDTFWGDPEFYLAAEGDGKLHYTLAFWNSYRTQNTAVQFYGTLRGSNGKALSQEIFLGGQKTECGIVPAFSNKGVFINYKGSITDIYYVDLRFRPTWDGGCA